MKAARLSAHVIAGLAALGAFAQPSMGQTPAQSYFDWARATFAPNEFADRRARMAAELATEDTRSVFLVPSAQGRSAGTSFRQADGFFYFTGLEVPGSVLAIASDGANPVLFMPRTDFRYESSSRPNDFPGRPLADDAAIGAWAGLEVVAIDRMEESLREWQARGYNFRVRALDEEIAGRPVGAFVVPVTPPLQLARYLQEQLPEASVLSATRAVRRVRGVKTPAEVDQLLEVAQLTERAIAHAVGFVRPGVTERELRAEFEAACKRGGGQRLPFTPIVKSGPNSLWPWRILASHYDRRNRAMESGELVIFDVGCELDHYVSDIGRTFPVSGRFTERQREILEMEVAVADRVIEAIKPGVTFADLRTVALEAVPAEHKPYMQAALFFGHHIGLSTGDPIDETEPLRPGMVFTVEPWYYNHDEQIAVFTEDVVTVTETGVEVLSRGLPRTPAELEAMVAGSRR